MFRKIRPLQDRVLVELIEGETRTAGGIYIPDAAKDKAQIGKVKAVGAGRPMEDGTVRTMGVKEGDTVFFGKYAGTDAGDRHMIIKEDEILGIVED
jgi:chaperonin GroES